MGWPALSAILVAGAAVYLLWSLSDGNAQPRAAQSRDVEREVEPAAPGSASGAPRPTMREARPGATSKQEPAPGSPTKSIERRAGPQVTADPPADAGEEEVPWTEQQRWQQLWTANGRYEKGNYPGAIDAAMEIA